MQVRHLLVTEFINLAIEAIEDVGREVTPQAAYQILTSWCTIYEDVPPRNRAETAVRDALESARDIAYANPHHTFVTKTLV